jgi:hypothetical protein
MAAAVVKAGGREEALDLISGLLMRHGGDTAAGRKELRFAAEQFLQLIVSTPQSRAMGLGVPMDRAELDAWIHGSVALFLGGFDSLRLSGASAARVTESRAKAQRRKLRDKAS